MDIFVFSDSPSLLAEMIAGANELAETGGGTASAIVIGTEPEAVAAFATGAGKVYWLGEKGNRLVDDFIPTIIKLVNDQKPAALLVSATVQGKAVAGRVAAALDTAAIVNAKEIANVNGSLQVRHVIYGGGAVQVEQSKGNVLVTTVGAGLYSAAPIDASRSGQPEKVEFVEPAVKTTKLGAKPKKTGDSNIGSAKRVVGTGRGFTTREDLQIARELANVLGGEVGYSRPLTEGDPPFAEGQPYIGVTGITIKPELYIAVGISGQTQHIVGVNESNVVVCINKEANALMFRHSDYGIVGDLYEVVPELTRALRGRRQ